MCSLKWVPRWRIQCSVPGVAKASWVLTRTGDTRWEYADNDVQWVLTYSTTSPNIVIQLYIGGSQYLTTFNGRPPWSGYINGWAIRICALGVVIPKEYTVTTSGIQPYPDYTMLNNPTSCSINNLVYFRELLSGSLNVTTNLSLLRFYAETSSQRGCGVYRSEPIATVRLSQYGNKDPAVWSVYVQVSGNNTIDVYAAGGVPDGWLMYWGDPPQTNCTGSIGLFHGTHSDMCDSTVTVDNFYPHCQSGQNNGAYGGHATATPIHNDNWTPPPSTWL